ncbi:hypothetical protein ILYODFUR_030849 [Ilyodon furcidens]|uniref:Uncharacterized protein n=1 Tax=Ilyodon furcidens TaxID=33524 RepID=A0ABV0T512_9TELE
MTSSNILDINPSRRITPINGLNHEFITMKHLSGATNSPYVTTSYKKMEKHPETEPEVGESTPPGPSQSQTAEESLDSVLEATYPTIHLESYSSPPP